MKGGSGGKGYVKLVIYVFLALAGFVGALVGAYFAGVGLFFGQAVVEGDVFTQGYKNTCNNVNETASTCTNISTTQTAVYTDYEAFRTDINDQTPLFLSALTIVFSLLGLVFLFLALQEAGLGRKKSKKESEY